MFSAESDGDFFAWLCFSIRLARCRAQESPPGPAPMIRTSASSCSRWMLEESVMAPYYQRRKMEKRKWKIAVRRERRCQKSLNLGTSGGHLRRGACERKASKSIA